jgi:hypothetical protein
MEGCIFEGAYDNYDNDDNGGEEELQKRRK